MARLSRGGTGGLSLRSFVWEMRRVGQVFLRHFGISGLCALLCVLVGMGSGVLAFRAGKQVEQVRAMALAAAVSPDLEPKRPIPVTGGREQLQAFEKYLLAHEEIPGVVQSLLALAGKSGLSIVHGDYRPQIDNPGQFMRYRMSMPVKGASQAVLAFIKSALLANPTLALESIQFKRERVDSAELEARIQWVVLTRLPPRAGQMPTDTAQSDFVGGGK